MNQSRSNSGKTGAPIRVAIIHYRDDATAGGSLRVGETIANHLDVKQVAAYLVFAYGEAGPVTKATRVPCHFLRAKGPKDFSAWKRARALFRELSPDLIHFQDAVVWLRASLLGAGYKTLLHVHGRYLPDYINRKSKALTRAFIRSTDGQVYITSGARDAALELGWADPRKAFVAYNSIDCTKFMGAVTKTSARTSLNLPQDVLLLGMLCRITRYKGCFDLLSILGFLPQRWHGVLCGDGPEREELEHLCKDRGISHRVHFIKAQDNVVPVYASLDAYAFLSRYEAFGLVLAEAMAAGVPLFGLKGDGEYTETENPLVTHENSVFLDRYNGNDQELPESAEVLKELARRIEHFGNYPDLYSEMIWRARSWVQERFNAPGQAESVAQIYKELVFRRPACKGSELNLSGQTRR